MSRAADSAANADPEIRAHVARRSKHVDMNYWGGARRSIRWLSGLEFAKRNSLNSAAKSAWSISSVLLFVPSRLTMWISRFVPGMMASKNKLMLRIRGKCCISSYPRDKTHRNVLECCTLGVSEKATGRKGAARAYLANGVEVACYQWFSGSIAFDPRLRTFHGKV